MITRVPCAERDTFTLDADTVLMNASEIKCDITYLYHAFLIYNMATAISADPLPY